MEGSNRDPHGSAVTMLVDGRTTDAVRALRQLVEEQPRNELCWSDLAAAQLEDSVAARDPRMTALALASADRALALDSSRAEALFNRALALDGLGIRFAAAAAWRHYLSVDSSSTWAIEAREHLRAADAPTRDQAWKAESAEMERASRRGDLASLHAIVRRFPQNARVSTEAIYLPRWGAAVLKGDAQFAQQSLLLARTIGDALRTINHDGLLHDATWRIDQEDTNVRLVAEAYDKYGRARVAYAARRFHDAVLLFAEAERGFAVTRTPMRMMAEYYRANALVDLGDPNGAEKIVESLGSQLDPAYRSLEAHVLWLRARVANAGGHPYETFVSAARARAIFESLGERDYATRVRIGEAAMLGRLGRDRDAWRERSISLADASASGKWPLIEVAIDAIARDEIDGPNPEIARSLLRVQVAAPSTLPLMRFNGLLWLAFLDAQVTGRLPELRVARESAAKIPDARQREDAGDELMLVEALAKRKSDPSAAERMFGKVIEYRTRNHLLAHLPAIHRQRGLVRRALSMSSEARDDFLAAISMTEERRVPIENETLRDAFLGRSSDAYAELSELLLEEGEWEESFNIAERARARVLVDRAERDAISLDELVARTPENVVAAHYTTLTFQTSLVVVDGGNATHHRLAIGRSELQSSRDRIIAAMESNDQAQVMRLSRELHELLIAPLLNSIDARRLLAVVPDESTYGIPFAVLQGNDGRYLVERCPIVLAPTAAAVPTRAETLAPQQSSVVVVADPAISSRVFPDLDRLPAARRDARVVTASFANAIVLTGKDATARAVETNARSGDAIHIAAHALSSERDASLSLLALAPSTQDDGILDLQDILEFDLPRRPLVVLAGCRTGSLGGGSGSLRSLAHAFLAAGSRSVLATAWNVEDESASALTDRFYRNLACGASFPDALREAQLASKPSLPVREWAAFQLHIGVPHI